MSSRSKGRKRALDILYEAELRGRAATAFLEERLDENTPAIAEFARVLVNGVMAYKFEIDTAITANSKEWDLDRLPGIDRNILRIAIYEIKWCAEVPNAVAIDEAVNMAKALSTDESAGFINGILGEINRELLVTPAVGDV